MSHSLGFVVLTISGSRMTLVIRADDTIFRVSKSVLCARSSVFRDMVAFPQPDVAAESLESSPVVCLHDCATDVEVFLRAIFDSNHFMPPPEPVDIHVVLGILRLAHKYDIQYLYRRALRHLGTEYPTSLADLDKDLDALNGTVPLGFTVIQAVAQVGALWLLRSAYCFLCSHPVHTIIEEAGEQWNCLSPAQRQPSLRADLHRVAGLVKVHKFLHTVPVHCEHPKKCKNIRFDVQKDLFAAILSAHGSRGAIGHWKEGSWTLLEIAGLCQVWLTDAKAKYSVARRKFWDSLPAEYGLPPWHELHSLRAAALGENDDD
ncbi:hypothetical protein B0H13DRAFT_2405622 [Mycena leptocephala]|nr:hypothetical protein B0H13DRAFT_2405622 [Mycena leptocephala]